MFMQIKKNILLIISITMLIFTYERALAVTDTELEEAELAIQELEKEQAQENNLNRRVEELLKVAKEDFAAERYKKPANNNALQKYQSVLELDATNQTAKLAIQEIETICSKRIAKWERIERTELSKYVGSSNIDRVFTTESAAQRSARSDNRNSSYPEPVADFCEDMFRGDEFRSIKQRTEEIWDCDTSCCAIAYGREKETWECDYDLEYICEAEERIKKLKDGC